MFVRALCVAVFTSLAFLADFFLSFWGVFFFLFSVCFSSTDKWTLLSDGERCSLRWRLTNASRRPLSRGATYRRPFGTTSSDALEQHIQDILLNTEALANALGVTAANVNTTGRAIISSGQRTYTGPTLPRRDSHWRHRTSCDRLSGPTVQENCSTPAALQASDIGLWSATP